MSARNSSLDRVTDELPTSSTLAPNLFAVVDALASQPELRRALTDPGTPSEARKSIAGRLFEGQLGPDAVHVVAEAAALRWSGAGAFAEALERQAVRAELNAAASDDKLDEVEDELFRFSRLVAGDRGLREALADRSRKLPDRQQLVARLLQGRAHEATVLLAQRAVAARERTFDATVEHYLEAAAALRNRAVATVRVAHELDPEQHRRLQDALSNQVGRPVAMHVVVDPKVLGGVRVELGDELIEGTVAGRLEDARRRFH